MKSVLITVGSTRFDALTVAAQSSILLARLAALGFSTVYLQHGHSPIAFEEDGHLLSNHQSIKVHAFKYTNVLSDYIRKADLVIAHAGSGTVLEVLYLHKPLLVIPNDALMDNHQVELGRALADQGHVVLGTVDTLADDISQIVHAVNISKLKPFRKPSGETFVKVLKDAVGFPE
ncbi:undecaprenyldiphospho-muramoylpentapeptide beta-N-acetylglucosaminyltransferase [Synchytrium endobioticum]|uniref:UDP-N-acetylglucosamine transferase subunit ALG13 n=1 Tax=Synchytrium endobioticum TaxID=286115 RepID=A0A507DE53_9FUNG|nr:undecaprenyldiphospho-muramoylpentapeptide beta-N-acetylglucosaminyltransferase [Synchytrium endobioticum]